MTRRITVLVADDEPAARRGVRQLLAAFPDFTVVGECRDGREVLAALDVLKPEVIFLDIQMPEIDGFEVIRRRTPARMPAIVFLTAYDQFAIRAFEAEAHDYLVKPVSEARFAATIKRLLKRIRSGDAAGAAGQAIVVSTARGTVVLRLREIDWIEAADNYARIWAGGRSYLLRESLGDLEKRVGAHGFARAHRQALVRIAGVRALRIEEHKGASRTDGKGDGRTAAPAMTAELTCGTKVPISRRRRAAFSAAVRSQLA
jgi:two-component system LytT family response regulator